MAGTSVTLVYVCLCLAGVYAIPDHSAYRGHKVYRVTPEKERHLRFLQALSDREALKSDFWTEPRGLRRNVDVQLAPEHHDAFETALLDQNIPYKVMVNELESFLTEQTRKQQEHKKGAFKYDFTEYLNYTAIMAWVDDAGETCGTRCEVFSIGETYEGRDIKVIKITNGDGVQKDGFWIDAGIHAREWISPATAMYFIERFILDFESDGEVQTMLANFDFYILPDLNADGYVHTWEEDRLWRKSRRPNTDVDSICYGTDVNRNYAFHFGEIGTSTNPCSQTYRGPNAYSEIEALNQVLYINQTASAGINWRVFFTMHSYGQLWMTPWGYTEDLPDDYQILFNAGYAGRQALTAVHGTQYELGSASQILYGSSGTSRDWAKGEPQIDYVYTLELRDQGEYGFLLPPDQILATGEETWAGIKAFTLFIIN